MESESQTALIQELLQAGNSLSEVQKILQNEHDINLTYMELRLIASELEEVSWEKQDEALNAAPSPNLTDPDNVLASGPDAPAGNGSTTVSVSKVLRPGAVMSGDVTFKSGARAEWYLDQASRLGFTPRENSEKPTEEDLREFQAELQSMLQRKG